MYLKLNPNLTPSPFLNRIDSVGKTITKFRLGSHKLKIETGRWSRVLRVNRLCDTCGVLGDEAHVVYHCSEIRRDDLNIPGEMSSLWEYEGVNVLFKRIMNAGYTTP